MLRVAYSQFLLPPRPGGKHPHVSSWKMTAEEAAALRAFSIVPNSTEWREVPETDQEKLRATMHYQSAGHDSVKPPPKG